MEHGALIIANVIALILAIIAFTYTAKISDNDKIATMIPFGYSEATAVQAYDQISNEIETEAEIQYSKGFNSTTFHRNTVGGSYRTTYYNSLTGVKQAVYQSNKSRHPYTNIGIIICGVFIIELIILSALSNNTDSWLLFMLWS